MPIKTFELSTQAMTELIALAERVRLTPAQTLEAIIMEFSPSSPEERLQQTANKLQRYKEDCNIRGNSGIEMDNVAWTLGFKAGWVLFQTRKFTSMFRRVGLDGGFKVSLGRDSSAHAY